MGVDISVYIFHGVKVPNKLIIAYIDKAYRAEALEEGYEEVIDYIYERCNGYEPLFKKSFGYGLIESFNNWCGGHRQYYLVIGEALHIHEHRGGDETLEYDFSTLPEPTVQDRVKVDRILSTLGTDPKDHRFGIYIIKQVY